MQILQGRKTDPPLSHAAKVQMGINQAPQPTVEILHVKDKLLSSPNMTYPLVRMSCTVNQMTKDGIQQLLSNNYQRRDHTSSEWKTMLFLEKHKYI